MLLGGKDDNLPVKKIETYLAYARAAGSPVQYVDNRRGILGR